MNIKPNLYNLQNRVEHALAIFKERNPALAEKMLWHDCEVRMNHRLRRAAGRCIFYRKLNKLALEFSEPMFAGMTEMEKTGTVQHELAHAVCFRTGAGDDHNAGWKRVCREMGGDGERLLSTKAVTQKNLVKRVVLTDRNNSYNLMVRTKMQAEKLLTYKANLTSLGTILVDPTNKTYRWATAISQEIRKIPVLRQDAGWKLIA
jgi:predicted SprT family Zn-dependent metalloprotease